MYFFIIQLVFINGKYASKIILSSLIVIYIIISKTIEWLFMDKYGGSSCLIRAKSMLVTDIWNEMCWWQAPQDADVLNLWSPRSRPSRCGCPSFRPRLRGEQISWIQSWSLMAETRYLEIEDGKEVDRTADRQSCYKVEEKYNCHELTKISWSSYEYLNIFWN